MSITRRRMAGPDHAVSTVENSEPSRARHEVCAECPWRLDAQIGAFPAEAYRHSAETAYDCSTHKFACHMAGPDKPQTCAGFLLAQGVHNLGVRFAMMRGELDLGSVRRTVQTYRTYRAMAIANGVDPDDPVLRGCRTARDALKRIEVALAMALSPHASKPQGSRVPVTTIISIKQVVAREGGYSVLDLESERRTLDLALHRHIAMWLCRQLTPRSLTSIGNAFGGRDQTTVMHALERIDYLRERDEGFRKRTDLLEADLLAAHFKAPQA